MVYQFRNNGHSAGFNGLCVLHALYYKGNIIIDILRRILCSVSCITCASNKCGFPTDEGIGLTVLCITRYARCCRHIAPMCGNGIFAAVRPFKGNVIFFISCGVIGSVGLIACNCGYFFTAPILECIGISIILITRHARNGYGITVVISCGRDFTVVTYKLNSVINVSFIISCCVGSIFGDGFNCLIPTGEGVGIGVVGSLGRVCRNRYGITVVIIGFLGNFAAVFI